MKPFFSSVMSRLMMSPSRMISSGSGTPWHTTWLIEQFRTYLKPYCPLLAGRAARSMVMKRSTRSLTCIVDMPARFCVSSISKTDASSLPEVRMSASSSGVLTMSGDHPAGHVDVGVLQLHLHDVAEGQYRVRLGEH